MLKVNNIVKYSYINWLWNLIFSFFYIVIFNLLVSYVLLLCKIKFAYCNILFVLFNPKKGLCRRMRWLFYCAIFFVDFMFDTSGNIFSEYWWSEWIPQAERTEPLHPIDSRIPIAEACFQPFSSCLFDSLVSLRCGAFYFLRE